MTCVICESRLPLQLLIILCSSLLLCLSNIHVCTFPTEVEVGSRDCVRMPVASLPENLDLRPAPTQTHQVYHSLAICHYIL